MKTLPKLPQYVSLPNNPRISVIIDNYNYGEFISQAIDSVLKQSYQNLEIIVVDDGSTDNSREVIASYGDRIIAIFQENQGQCQAFNTGIRQASGDIVCLLDSDDYFSPDKVQKVVDGFRSHPEWVQIANYWEAVDANACPLKHYAIKTLSTGDVRSLILRQGKYKMAITSALSYRREVLQKLLPLPERGSPDGYLMLNAPFYGEIGCINEILTSYRIHGKNKFAQTADIAKLIYRREVHADQINAVASRVDINQVFSLKNDADYQLYKYIENGKLLPLKAVKIALMTLNESIAMKRKPRKLITKFANVLASVLMPEQGNIIISMGLTSYISLTFLKKKA